MVRTMILSAVVFVGAVLLTTKSAGAAGISRQNPYRSFNISGINYGSLAWERSHGNYRRTAYHRGGGFLFRRR